MTTIEGPAAKLPTRPTAGSAPLGAPSRRVRAYVADTRDPVTIERCRAAGLGFVYQRGRIPRDPTEDPWFYDNRVFEDWKAGRRWGPVDDMEYLADLQRIARMRRRYRPRFVVLPDVVGDALATARMALDVLSRLASAQLVASTRDLLCAPEHYAKIARQGIRFAFAVQDGAEVYRDWLTNWFEFWRASLTTIFVGGTLDWKLKTAASWARFAHEHGLVLHVGRIGTGRKVDWAFAAGVDSIDSAVPLWSRENLDVFVRALRRGEAQETLPLGEAR